MIFPMFRHHMLEDCMNPPMTHQIQTDENSLWKEEEHQKAYSEFIDCYEASWPLYRPSALYSRASRVPKNPVMKSTAGHNK